MPQKCFECGRKATYQHHVVPKSRGGTKTVPLCETCHGAVHMLGMRADHRALCRETSARRKREGKVVGAVSYGYRVAKDGRAEKDPVTYPIVERIVGEYQQGLSTAEIVRKLLRDKIPTARQKGTWHAQVVLKILEKAGVPRRSTSEIHIKKWKTCVTTKQRQAIHALQENNLNIAHTAKTLGLATRTVRSQIIAVAGKDHPLAEVAKAMLAKIKGRREKRGKPKTAI